MFGCLFEKVTHTIGAVVAVESGSAPRVAYQRDHRGRQVGSRARDEEGHPTAGAGRWYGRGIVGINWDADRAGQSKLARRPLSRPY